MHPPPAETCFSTLALCLGEILNIGRPVYMGLIQEPEVDLFQLRGAIVP